MDRRESGRKGERKGVVEEREGREDRRDAFPGMRMESREEQ